jgi:hypothetical protein
MKMFELFENRNPPPQAVPWPTNLAWRINLTRYKNEEYFLDFRRGKAFAMPFRNWEMTFYKLTLKDVMKIKYMDTQVIQVPDDALVADMAHIDRAMGFIIKNDPTGSMKRGAQPHLDRYQDTMVSYSRFKSDPYVFEKPEIMVERKSMRLMPYKVTPIWNAQEKEIQLYLIPRK